MSAEKEVVTAVEISEAEFYQAANRSEEFWLGRIEQAVKIYREASKGYNEVLSLRARYENVKRDGLQVVIYKAGEKIMFQAFPKDDIGFLHGREISS